MNASFLSNHPQPACVKFSPRASTLLAAITALFFVAAIDDARAQVYQTWRSEATSGSWQGNINWWKGSAGAIEFGQQDWNNDHYTSQTNQNGGNTLGTWRWLLQSGASSAHTFSGDAVRFSDFSGSDPAIINQSGATHIINMNIEGDGDSGDPLKIQIDNNSGGGLTFGGNINNRGSTIDVIGSASSAATVTFNGVISGTAGLYKENSNLTVVMTNANTYTGTTRIQSGVLRLQGSGSLASSAVRLDSGGTLQISNSATVASVAEQGTGNGGVIAISNGATLTIDGSATGLSQNSISGAGGLTFSGSGGLSLYGTQSYTGTTTVTGGTLSTGSAMSSGNYSLTGGTFRTTLANVILSTATMTLGNGTLSFGAAETFGEAGVTLSSGTTGTIAVDTSISATLSGAVSGSGNLVKTNAGQLNLSGNNTYTGTTTVGAGSLEVQSADALGNTSAGTTVNSGAELRLWHATQVTVAAESLTLNGTGISSGGALRNISGANTWQGSISNNSGARIMVDAGSLTVSGNVANADTTLYVGGASNSTFSGTITGSRTAGDGALFKDGAGTMTVSANNASTLTGLIEITGGTLALSGSGDLSGASRIDVGGSDIFNISGITASGTSVKDISEQGTGDGGSITLGSKTLTLNAGPASTTRYFNVLGTSGDTGGFTLNAGNSSYTLSLYGASSYTGTTTVTSGTLTTSATMSSANFTINGGTFTISAADRLSDTAAFNISSGSFNVNGNETIGALSGSGGTVTVNTGTLTTSFDTASNNFAGTVTGTGGLTKSGSGTLTLSGSSANTYAGLTTVSGGTLELNKSSGDAIAGATTINSGAVLLLSASNQVDSGVGDTVTLSGGTIQRASGVSEVFGNLNVTQASVINYSGGTGNSLTFTGLNYAPSSTLKLELQNFTQGNTLVIQNTSNWSSLINTGFTFAGSGGFGSSSFVDNGGGTGTFTITAIPEPSTYLAAAGLLALFLWPVRRRLIQDAKSIFGLRPTGRERIEACRNA